LLTPLAAAISFTALDVVPDGGRCIEEDDAVLRGEEG
jgi:hypothetical protein